MYKKNFTTVIVISLCCMILQLCKAQTDPNNPNILLIVADDLGSDALSGFWPSSTLEPTTPFLDSLRNTGVAFTNCWATPQCTPTRAAIMSGKYGINTGVQKPPGNLDLIHTSIFDAVKTQSSNAYETAVIGKWHVSEPFDYNHPDQHGVDFYTGVFGGEVDDYYDWEKIVAEIPQQSTTYATTDFTNEAENWINNRTSAWFLTMTHVAPHSPFQDPPANLYSISPTSSNRRKYIASIEAMDAELRRLARNINPAVLANTVIIFIGDNGTPNTVLQSFPSGRGKGTIYQGGVSVPLIVSGTNVTRQNVAEDAMVNAADIYATILEIAGGTLPGGIHNSYSFYDFLTNPAAVGRPYNYIDYDYNSTGGDQFIIRNSQYKLLQFGDGRQEFYDLISHPYEGVDLLLGSLTPTEQAAYDDLELEALYIRTGWSCRDLIQNGTETSVDVGGAYCGGAIPPCSYDNAMNFTNIGCSENPDGRNEHYEIICDDKRIISTTNFPNHEYGYNSPTQIPEDSSYIFFMDATPSLATETTSIRASNGRPSFYFGVGTNGVQLAPAPSAPFIFENTNTGELNYNWVFEPTNNQGSGPDRVGLDCASAHTGDNRYHYHGNPFAYAEAVHPGISTATTPPAGPFHIGWAADGYPILYRFGPDGTGGLALLQPGYEVKPGDRPGDGINSPCGPYNGKYTADYQHNPAVGDLDECNGIQRDVTLNTVDGPQTFDYFYMITDDFPQISRCFVGEPDQSFNFGAETPCFVKMEMQDVTLNNGQSITVGTNTYNTAGEYKDTITGSNNCDSIIVTRIGAVLPLSLISFEALNRQNKWVDLLWETTDEVNVSHFEIERSFNARDWEKKGKVNTLGNLTGSSYYQFQDDWSDIPDMASLTVYYRLRIVDLDESYEYSNIKSVKKEQKQSLNIFHDRDEQSIYISSEINWDEPLDISILDLRGQKVQSASVDIAKGNQMALKLESLPSNLYFVLVEDKYGTLESKKIVINNH